MDYNLTVDLKIPICQNKFPANISAIWYYHNDIHDHEYHKTAFQEQCSPNKVYHVLILQECRDNMAEEIASEETSDSKSEYGHPGYEANQDIKNPQFGARRNVFLMYLLNFFTALKLVRVSFLKLYPDHAPRHPPGQCKGYRTDPPRTHCREEDRAVKTQAERLSTIALLLRTMQVIKQLQQAYREQGDPELDIFKHKLHELENHYHHGLAYLNYMASGTFGELPVINSIIDLLKTLEGLDVCEGCHTQFNSIVKPNKEYTIRDLIQNITNICDKCDIDKEVCSYKLRQPTIGSNFQRGPEYTMRSLSAILSDNSCQSCEDMLLDVFLHSEINTFEKCHVRMMGSIQVRLNQGDHDKHVLTELYKTMKNWYYYESERAYELLLMSGQREEKDEKDQLMKIMLEQKGRCAFHMSDIHQTTERKKCCCEPQALKHLGDIYSKLKKSSISKDLLKTVTSVSLVLEQCPCSYCHSKIIPKIRLPQQVTFTVHFLLSYAEHSIYPHRLYAEVVPQVEERHTGGAICLRASRDYNMKYSCLMRKCPHSQCEPGQCYYAEHENILEITHVYYHSKTFWIRDFLHRQH